MPRGRISPRGAPADPAAGQLRDFHFLIIMYTECVKKRAFIYAPAHFGNNRNYFSKGLDKSEITDYYIDTSEITEPEIQGGKQNDLC